MSPKCVICAHAELSWEEITLTACILVYVFAGQVIKLARINR